MILYVNGDSHSVGHGTGSHYGLTINDPSYQHIDEAPHPLNLPNSYGAVIARKKNWDLICQARSGGSLDRAIRTTKQFVYQTQGKLFVIIGIPSLEREEWFYQGAWYQINSSGHEVLPQGLQLKYKNWIINSDVNNRVWDKQIIVHNQLFEFHQWLNLHNVKHLFFHCSQPLTSVGKHERFEEYDWDDCFFEPYGSPYSDGAFCNWCRTQGFSHDNWGHFGTDAHQAWAEHIMPAIERLIKK